MAVSFVMQKDIDLFPNQTDRASVTSLLKVGWYLDQILLRIIDYGGMYKWVLLEQKLLLWNFYSATQEENNITLI